MTVQELIEILSDLPGDRQVVLQKDGEGNAYSPLAGVDDNTKYVAENSYMGDVFDLEHEEGIECVVLYPIN